jgi:hypothetical protein
MNNNNKPLAQPNVVIPSKAHNNEEATAAILPPTLQPTTTTQPADVSTVVAPPVVPAADTNLPQTKDGANKSTMLDDANNDNNVTSSVASAMVSMNNIIERYLFNRIISCF